MIDSANNKLPGGRVALADGKTPVPCFDPYCCTDATVLCYDQNINRPVAFCDKHAEDWIAHKHIIRANRR